MSKIEMKIERAKSKNENRGWVLFGYKDNQYGWFERWYKTEDAARKYAARKNWPVVN